MKHKARPKGSSAVRSAIVLVAVLATAIGVVRGVSDVMAKLGVSPGEAQEGMLDALASGYAYNAAAIKAFKALPPAARAEVVREALGWIKARTESAEFKAAYAKWRQEEKPAPPDAVASADEQIKKQKADMEKAIAETEKNMAGLDAQTRKALEGALEEMRKQVRELDKPEMKAIYGQSAEMQKAAGRKDHEERMKRWEETAPPDPWTLIARRIRQFLDVTKDVDFSAKLVPQGSKMRFADARYEEKPGEWKLCFRAGREATEAAREFAKAWLAELGR